MLDNSPIHIGGPIKLAHKMVNELFHILFGLYRAGVRPIGCEGKNARKGAENMRLHSFSGT